jgi:hypothetical protein
MISQLGIPAINEMSLETVRSAMASSLAGQSVIWAISSPGS